MICDLPLHNTGCRCSQYFYPGPVIPYAPGSVEGWDAQRRRPQFTHTSQPWTCPSCGRGVRPDQSTCDHGGAL